MRALPGIIILFAVALTGCRRDADVTPAGGAVDGPFRMELPPGFPPVPDDPAYPMTEASVALGRALFFDPRLSRDGTVACASCHFPDRAFSDTVALSAGIEGRLGMRNGTPLFNLAWHPAFFRDGGVPTLAQLSIAPIHDPNEMDFSIQLAAERLMNEDPYARLSQLAYGEPFSAFYLVRALASYQRTLISGWSRYDRFLQGEANALTEQEQRGLALFNSQELNCSSCHSGFDLTDHQYHNIGLYTLSPDPGRERITLDPMDQGRFKTPSLRNVALTAPYMHDGTLHTLGQVVDHFASGGQAAPNKSPQITGFSLTEQDKEDLIAFLQALTDERKIDQTDLR